MKKKITLVSLVTIFIALLTLSVSAINIKEFSSDSTFKPVSYSTHKSVSSVTLYGNADYLCMKAYSEKNSTELFCLDIYSDSKYKNPVSSYSNTFKVGTKYENILFDLTGFESGTYYAKAYVKKQSINNIYGGSLKKDPDTEVKFKIVVNRKGSTDIKNAKVVMFAYENTENGPTLYWYNQPKAKGYYIYRKDGDTYKKIATVKTNKGNFGQYTDKSLKGKNATKYYKIKAYSGSTVSGFSKNYVKAIIVKTPTVKVQAVDSDRVKVSWSSVGVKNAKYYVYRATGKNGEWEQMTSTTKTNFYDSVNNSNKLKNNTLYYYTVIAETSTAISGHDVSGVAIRFLQSPNLKTVTATKDSITITWDKRTGAGSYEVYRRQNQSDEWVKVGTSDTTSYTDKTSKESTAYYYTVKAVKDKYVGSYKSVGLCAGYFIAPKVNDITEFANGNPIITWSESANCGSYAVYRRESTTTEWKEIATTKELTYTDKDTALESGKEYFYTVKGIHSVDSEVKLYSDMDETGKGAIYYGILKNLAPDVAEKGVALVWDKVSGAAKYSVYRKTQGEEYTLIGTTVDSFYNDLSAEKDMAYTYRVTYFVGDREMTTYGTETKALLKDNIIELSDEERITESNINYYTLKIKDADPFALYSFYIKTDKGMKLHYQSKTSDGSFKITHPTDVTEAEFVVTAVKEDGTVYGFDGAESFRLYYPKLESPAVNSNQAQGRIEISWAAIDGAEKYYVYKFDKLIATVEDGTEYIDTDFEENKSYSYSIGVVVDNCFIKGYYYARGCIMKIPEIEWKIEEDRVSLHWDTIAPCEVFRRKEGETNWTKLTKTHDTFYYDLAGEDSQTYYYTVRPYHDTYGYGRYDETGVKICYMMPVKLSKLEISGNKIIVEWPKKAAAESYELYRKAQGESKWSLIKTYGKDDKFRYEDTKIKNGTQYDYSVVAVNGTSKSAIVGENVVYFTAVKLISAKATDEGIVVKFENLSSKDGYTVYRKTKNGKWQLAAMLSDKASSYTDRSVKSGTKYTYTVFQSRGTAEGPYDTKGVSATAK